MKSSPLALSVTTLSLALLTPALSHAQSPAQGEAEHMVPARASLSRTLDADHAAPGYQFRATLRDTVHLNGSTELHRGDVLLGTVANDDMNTGGKSHLAVRFTQAVLKNGQTIPIKATIVAFYAPDDLAGGDSDTTEQIPNGWNDGTLTVDQIGVTKDVDLHSRIASDNSGVFVSTRNADVKLPAGSELALAIAAQPNSNPNSGE
jgi:hypothetical protein